MGTSTLTTDGGGADAGLMLLYAAGELSAEDRAAVDRTLAVDPAAAALAADVAGAYSAAMASVEAADAADPIAPAVAAASLRRTGRLLRQWQVDRLTRRTAPADGGRRADPQWWRRLPSWTYAAAVAAVLVTGAVAWWGVGSNDSATAPAGNPTVADSQTTTDGDGAGLADNDATADVDRLEKSFTSDVPAGLTDAETQASALPANHDLAATSSVFFGASD